MRFKKVLAGALSCIAAASLGISAFAADELPEKDWDMGRWPYGDALEITNLDYGDGHLYLADFNMNAAHEDSVIIMSAYTGDVTEDGGFGICVKAFDENNEQIGEGHVNANVCTDTNTGEKYAVVQAAFDLEFFAQSDDSEGSQVSKMSIFCYGDVNPDDVVIIVTLSDKNNAVEIEDAVRAEAVSPLEFSYDAMMSADDELGFMNMIEIVPKRFLDAVENDEEICAFAYTDGEKNFAIMAVAYDEDGSVINSYSGLSINSACEIKFTKNDFIKDKEGYTADNISSVRVYIAGNFRPEEEYYAGVMPYKTIIANNEGSEGGETGGETDNPDTGAAIPAASALLVSAAALVVLKKRK